MLRNLLRDLLLLRDARAHLLLLLDLLDLLRNLLLLRDLLRRILDWHRVGLRRHIWLLDTLVIDGRHMTGRRICARDIDRR